MLFQFRSIQKLLIALGVFSSALLLAGCPVIIPDTPPPAGGAQETPYSFKHQSQFTWNAEQLNALRSLKVKAPGHISLLQSVDHDELSVQFQFEVEKPNNQSYSDEFFKQILAQSSLQSQDEKLLVPAPSHLCKETRDANGQLTHIEGICIREMLIQIPSASLALGPLSVEPAGGLTATGIALPFLTLILDDDDSHSEITQWTGNLKITGGGPKASLVVNGLLDAGQKTSGDLDLELVTIQRADLQNIAGKVHIAVTQPSGDLGAVTLDGKPITSFPFDRP